MKNLVVKLFLIAAGLWQQEGETFVEINKEGLRDRYYAKIKPNNTLRIALLGDSFAEVFQVSMEDSFWAIVEGKNAEVINFGIRGYGTAEELIVLRNHVWDYDLNLVVLAFSIGNDLINNSPVLEYNKHGPFFVLQDDKLWVKS